MRRVLPYVIAGTVAVPMPGTAAAQQSGGPPEDSSRAGYTRIYCAADAETHFETVTAELRRINATPPAPPIYLGGAHAATRATFAGFEPHWGSQDASARTWHPAPVAQFVVMLRGVFSITTSDGETRRFEAGDVIRVEDTAPCKGHITVAGDRPVLVMLIR